MVDVDEELKKAAKNLGDKEPKIKEEPKKSKLPLYLIVVLVLLLVAIFLVTKAEFVIKDTKNVTKMRNVTYETEKKISYKKYFDEPRSYHTQSHSLKGYLYYEYSYDADKEIGSYTPYVMDDFNRRMKLDRLSSSERSFFVRGNKTEQIYNVSGIMMRLYPGFRIEVNSIEPAEPDMVEKIRQEPYNETVIIERRIGLWEKLSQLMANI